MAARLLKRARRGLTKKVQAAAYNNPLYQKFLDAGARPPGRLHFTLPDLWPGDAQAGLALIGAQGALFGATAPQHPATTLRNLRAVGTDVARQMALRLIADWLDRFDHWASDEWSPDHLGDRLASWIGFYEFYAPAAPPEFLARLAASLQRQHRARLHRLPVHMHHAGAALAGVAAHMGARQMQLLPQQLHQKRPPLNLDIMLLAVHRQRYVRHRSGSSLNPNRVKLM